MPPLRELSPALLPREKMAARGAETLTDAELLAVLLGSGIRGRNVKKVAESILARFREKDLLTATPAELEKIPGVGAVKAGQLVAAFQLAARLFSRKGVRRAVNSAEDAAFLCQELVDAKQEKLVALFLDSRRGLLAKEEIFRGTVDGSLVHPREVFSLALEKRASALILLHNHPSGEPAPSREDLELTRRFRAAGELLGIPLLDHVVVARGGVESCGES